MIWVITGATGLIGRSLVPALLGKGHRVVALSRSASNFYAGFDHHRLDARNFDLTSNSSMGLGDLSEDVGLIMLASKISVSTDLRKLVDHMAIDTYGHIRLTESLRSVLTHIIYASSCTVYGWPSQLPVDESATLNPSSVYALTKVASEHMITSMCHNWGISLAILRISQLYGPGAPLIGAMYNFLKAAYAGDRPSITCNPDSYRDYCHVADVVRAIDAVVLQNSKGIYNIGSGQPTSILNLAKICLQVASCNLEPEIEPRTIGTNMWLDISRARNELSYEPRIELQLGVQMEYERLYSNHQKMPVQFCKGSPEG